jgi:hypothetical protein
MARSRKIFLPNRGLPSDIREQPGWPSAYHGSARKGVLLLALGVREGDGFEVLDWRGAFGGITRAYEERLTPPP